MSSRYATRRTSAQTELGLAEQAPGDARWPVVVPVLAPSDYGSFEAFAQPDARFKCKRIRLREPLADDVAERVVLDGEWCGVGRRSGAVELYRTHDVGGGGSGCAGDLCASTCEHRGWVVDVWIGSDRQLALSASADETAMVWRIDMEYGSLHHLATLFGHSGWVHCVAGPSTAGGDTLVSGGADGLVRLWSLGSSAAREICQLPGHTSYVHRALMLPGTSMLATGSGPHEHSLRLWDCRSAEALAHMPAPHGDCLMALAAGPVGTHALFSACLAGLVAQWDLRRLASPVVCRATHGPVVALGADSTLLVSGDLDGAVCFWSTVCPDSVDAGAAPPARRLSAASGVVALALPAPGTLALADTGLSVSLIDAAAQTQAIARAVESARGLTVLRR